MTQWQAGARTCDRMVPYEVNRAPANLTQKPSAVMISIVETGDNSWALASLIDGVGREKISKIDQHPRLNTTPDDQGHVPSQPQLHPCSQKFFPSLSSLHTLFKHHKSTDCNFYLYPLTVGQVVC